MPTPTPAQVERARSVIADAYGLPLTQIPSTAEAVKIMAAALADERAVGARVAVAKLDKLQPQPGDLIIAKIPTMEAVAVDSLWKALREPLSATGARLLVIPDTMNLYRLPAPTTPLALTYDPRKITDVEVEHARAMLLSLGYDVAPIPRGVQAGKRAVAEDRGPF